MQSCGGYPWFPSVSDAGVMTSFTHDTAPTQYAEGNLDDHDPALSDVVGLSFTTRATRKGTGYSW